MADHQNYFDDESVRKIVRDHYRLKAMYQNLDAEVRQLRRQEVRPGLQPTFFRNDSGETIPAWAVVADAGVISESGVPEGTVSGVKASTTFRRRYFYNGPHPVGDGDVARIQRGEFQKAAHDTSWAPALGEAAGPKPDSWLLWKGYPSICTVTGRYDAEYDILLGTLSPISTLLCKATDTISGDSSTTDYIILAGTAGSETDAGFTTVPSAYHYADSSLATDDLFTMKWVNNGWAIKPFGGGGTAGARRFLAVLDGDMDATDASATVILGQAFDGEPLPGTTSVTATNALGLAAADGDYAIVTENLDGDASHSYLIENLTHYDCETL